METILEKAEFSAYTDVGDMSRQVDISPREYYSLMNDIRNMRVLSEHQRAQLPKLSRERLLEIIEVYDLIMKNVNEMFS